MGSSLFVQHLGDIRGHNNQRRSSVNSSTSVLELELFVSKSNRLKLNLPVSLPPDGNVLQLASVCALINSAEDSFASILLRATETEREDGLIEQVLREHVVEGRDNVVDRDGVVTETEDTVKLAESESKSGLFGRLGKVLVLDCNVADGHGIARDKALERAGTVSDGKLCAVRLVGGRGGGVKLGVELKVSA